MLAAAVFVLLVLAVALLSRRGTGGRIRLRSCCGARAWPPDDLTRDGAR